MREVRKVGKDAAKGSCGLRVDGLGKGLWNGAECVAGRNSRRVAAEECTKMQLWRGTRGLGMVDGIRDGTVIIR